MPVSSTSPNSSFMAVPKRWDSGPERVDGFLEQLVVLLEIVRLEDEAHHPGVMLDLQGVIRNHKSFMVREMLGQEMEYKVAPASVV